MRGVFVRVLLVVTCLFAVAGASSALADGNRASHRKGFVKIAEGRELYVDYVKAAPGRPTLILLNGLTYRVGSWDRFARQLEGHGYGILQFDPMGQGRTLLKYAPVTQPIDIEDQTSDLELLIDTLGIRTQVHLVGLSYGGAFGALYAAQNPDKVASLILMAPFVAPLTSQDLWIKLQVQQTRVMFPNNEASDDELYDYFLRQIIYTTYPSAEPIVLENPFKLEATFRLVQGVRKFFAKDVAHLLPKGKVHLMVARQDQYVPNYVHDEFWEQVPADARASRIYIHFTEHKIPEFIPRFSAAWVRRIVEAEPLIAGDKTFQGWPWSGAATSGDIVINGLGGFGARD